MNKIILIFCGLFFTIASCKKNNTDPLPGDTGNTTGTPSEMAGLKDIIYPHLPSPYYHFEYDDQGKLKLASFASDFFRYDVKYLDQRIIEMKNIFGNNNSLRFLYDNSGRIISVNYLNDDGSVFRRVNLDYNGPMLIGLQREELSGNDFSINKTLSMSYDTDSNLSELKVFYPAFNGNEATNLVYHFSQYDTKTNVDGFSLLHTEFFEQLILLPGVRLQKNNPMKETLTGDGNNYIVDYTYTYNSNDLPLTKAGDLVFTSGRDTGKHFNVNAFYSYY